MKLRLLASAVLVAAASASTTGIAHAAVAPPTVTITAAYDSSADGIDLTLTRPANWRWGNCSLTGSYSDANETTYTINVPPFDAGSSYNSPATYAGTIAANFNAVGPLTNIQITATCHLSGRQAYKASVKVAHLKTQIAAAPAAHTGCTQGRVKDSWIVSCGGSAATVTWTHTFPPNAVVGTRACGPTGRPTLAQPNTAGRGSSAAPCTRPSTSAGSSPCGSPRSSGPGRPATPSPATRPSQTPPLPRRQPDPKRRVGRGH